VTDCLLCDRPAAIPKDVAFEVIFSDCLDSGQRTWGWSDSWRYPLTNQGVDRE